MIGIDTVPRSPPSFRVRDATLDDVKDLTRLWYNSFNESHRFYDYLTPRNAETREWLDQVWITGFKAGPEVLRTFVVEDLENATLVAFCRIHVPQPDGNQDIPVPPLPTGYDPELDELVWGGMAKNRANIMGRQLHWMGEFLGVDKPYQGRGLAAPMLEWLCYQADETGLPVYLDASPVGLPMYKKRYGFKEVFTMVLEHQNTYGTYELVSMVRPPKRPGFQNAL